VRGRRKKKVDGREHEKIAKKIEKSGNTMERYQKIRMVGKGSFGAAWLMRSLVDGCEYVVKLISVKGMSPKVN
jgi:hypothetical protein